MMIVIAWLLMAGVAGAETGVVTADMLKAVDSCGLAGVKQVDGVCEVTLHIEPGWRVIYEGRSVSCLSTMEAAMEAMDWHVEHLVHPSRDPEFYRYQTNREALIAAYRQWTEAKACWRKP